MRVGRYVLAVYDDEGGRVESGERDANSGMEESKRVQTKDDGEPTVTVRLLFISPTSSKRARP